MKALVIGASGSTGRMLVDYLITSKKWKEVLIISRRKLSIWESMPMTDCEVKFVMMDRLDILGKPKDEILQAYPELDIEGFSSVFNCLGSRVGKGEEEFRRVDLTYVVYSASLCEKFNIPHFSHVSSQGSDKKSCLLYMRVKGEVEAQLKIMNIQNISIFKPGAILNRDNDFRIGECFLKFFIYLTCCLAPHIECKDLAESVGFEAERVHANHIQGLNFYDNSQIKVLSHQSKLK